ncbi:MAG TPA: class I SAM-dependent methyltransferase [Sedimentisphaerales bacterium]|jgi:SAM-dependent methyltransferase|nr:class I SAM-dependent methyltransferase [Sedimentisphaerales bacterium]HNU29753.1 class I SAM-dependent methyltransferase [Sedimentisphaerales bacterium]
MSEPQKRTNGFFEHFSKGDQPTQMGLRMVGALSRRIFAFAAVPEGGSVLEIGPGRGPLADLCLQRGIHYSAVEANESMADSLRQRGAQVVCARVPPLPEFDRTFDVVIMVNVMEHMDTMSAALQTAQQVWSLLRPGGQFVVHSPDYLNWRLNFFNCDFTHNYVTTRRRLTQLLQDAGFVAIRSTYMSGPLTGIAALIATSLLGRVPFGWWNAVLPENRIVYKLYKGQLSFLRKVLIAGKKPE